MAEAKKKTLFDVVKPLILLFNFLYGFNLGSRKPPGCLKQLCKKLRKSVIGLIFLFCSGVYFADKLEYHASSVDRRWMLIIAIFCCAFYLFAFDEPEMERLIMRLEGYPMGEKSFSATSKMTAIGIIAMAILLTPLLIHIFKALPHMDQLIPFFSLLFTKNFYRRLASEFNSFYGVLYVFWLIVHVIIWVVVILSFFGYFFPVFKAVLGCVLVSYCPSRLDDQVEAIRRAHSPLRRARLLSHLCHAYYRLQPLASMTNNNMATAMSMFKVFTMLLWAFCCYLLESEGIWMMLNVPFLQYSIPLLMFLQVAPSANQMHCKIFAAAAEVLIVDDQWQGHDSISRSLLIKMRLNLLKHLDHIRMDEGPFTLLGDSVDPETLFTIFVEINDLRTMLR